jgi:hypothetical protein
VGFLIVGLDVCTRISPDVGAGAACAVQLVAPSDEAPAVLAGGALSFGLILRSNRQIASLDDLLSNGS